MEKSKNQKSPKDFRQLKKVLMGRSDKECLCLIKDVISFRQIFLSSKKARQIIPIAVIEVCEQFADSQAMKCRICWKFCNPQSRPGPRCCIVYHKIVQHQRRARPHSLSTIQFVQCNTSHLGKSNCVADYTRIHNEKSLEGDISVLQRK